MTSTSLRKELERTMLALALLTLAGCADHDTDGRGGLDLTAPNVIGTSVTPIARRKPETVTVVEIAAEEIIATKLVLAAEGGFIKAGRHQLLIPPGALAKDTEITLKDMTGVFGYVACEALPEGLVFLNPVTLETTFGDLKNPEAYTTYWVANPGRPDEAWINMKTSLTADGTGLSTQLEHFSIYVPGKAGWGPRRGGPPRGLPGNGVN